MSEKLNNIDKALIATASTSGAFVATGVTASAVGFSTGGIVAGSTAAGIQAGIGNVVTGSAFAIAQSLGASGTFVAIGVTGSIGLAVAGIFGVVKLVKHLKNKDKKKD